MKRILICLSILILLTGCSNSQMAENTSETTIIEENKNESDNEISYKEQETVSNIELSANSYNDISKMLPTNLNLFDVVTYGKYEQDGNLSNGPENIEWYVINIDNNKVMLLSKNVLDAKMYNDSYSCTWVQSYIREWLNSEFLSNAFANSDALELKRSEAKKTDKSIDYKWPASLVAKDKVFLLTTEEVSKYGIDDDILRGVPTNFAKNNGLFYIKNKYINDGECIYWLSNSIKNFDDNKDWLSNKDSFSPHYVLYNNKIDFENKSIEINNQYIGVRPCIVYNMSYVATKSEIDDVWSEQKISTISNTTFKEAEEFFKINNTFKKLRENDKEIINNNLNKIHSEGLFLSTENLKYKGDSWDDADFVIKSQDEVLSDLISGKDFSTQYDKEFGMIYLLYNDIKKNALSEGNGELYAQISDVENKKNQEAQAKQKSEIMSSPVYQKYFNSQTLSKFAVGTEGVDYRYISSALKVYRLGYNSPKSGILGAFKFDDNFNLNRTDFADGLQDNDGNGIDDRDPINSLGCYDLNYDGIDDRSIFKSPFLEDNAAYMVNGDVKKSEKIVIQGRLNYMCPHGIINKCGNNNPGEEAYKTNVICSICYAEGKAKYDRNQSVQAQIDAAGGPAEYAGYSVGSQNRFGDKIWTYEGNGVWRSESGETANSFYDFENNRMVIGGFGNEG